VAVVRFGGGADCSLDYLSPTLAFYFRPSLLLLAAVGGALLLLKRPAGCNLFLALWAVLPVIVLAALGTNLVKVTAHYAFCALPAVLLLCGSFCVSPCVPADPEVPKGAGSAARWQRSTGSRNTGTMRRSAGTDPRAGLWGYGLTARSPRCPARLRCMAALCTGALPVRTIGVRRVLRRSGSESRTCSRPP
jgi:hypothetical protein